MAIQIDEAEIDFELGQVTEANRYLWTYPEPEMRYLEDIQEEEEKDLSASSETGHSSGKSGRCSVASGTSSFRRQQTGGELPNYRNEALAALPNLDPLTLGGLEMLGITAESLNFTQGAPSSIASIDEHPLRILSKEGVYDGMGCRSDSFSVTSEHLESLSLPATDQLDEEVLTDEDLEKAMAASLTSIRSHEILEKLKTESQWQELRENAAVMRKKQSNRGKTATVDHFNGNEEISHFDNCADLDMSWHGPLVQPYSLRTEVDFYQTEEEYIQVIDIPRLCPDGASTSDLEKSKGIDQI